MEINSESMEKISRGLMGLCLYVLQSRLNTQPGSAGCSSAPSLHPISATMDGDHLRHRPSCSNWMEAHRDRYPPIGRQHSLDDFVYRDMETLMDELKWDLLTEVQGRVEAEIFKTYLVANGIEDVELFQESLGQYVYPTTLDILGNVQVFVPKELLEEANQLLEEYVSGIQQASTDEQDDEPSESK